MAVAMTVLVMSMEEFTLATGVILLWLVDGHRRAFGYRRSIPFIKVRLSIWLKELAVSRCRNYGRRVFHRYEFTGQELTKHIHVMPVKQLDSIVMGCLQKHPYP